MITSFSVFFVMGISLAFFVMPMITNVVYLIGVFLLLLVGACLFRKGFASLFGRATTQLTSKFLLMCSALVFGVCVAQLDLDRKQQVARLPAPKDIQTLKIQITELPKNQANGVRFVAQILADDAVPKQWHQQKIRLSVAGLESNDVQVFAPGQVVLVSMLLRKPRGLKNFSTSSFGFGAGADTEHQAFLDEIAFDARVASGVGFQWLDRRCDGVLIWINCQRYQLGQQIEATLSHSRWRGTMIALAVGNPSDIETEVWDIYNQLGLTHLISVSGFHITFFAALVLWAVLRLMGLWRSFFCPKSQVVRAWQRVLPVVLAFLASMVVAVITGFAPPAQRTLLMLSVACLAKMWVRPIAPGTQIAVAMMLCLCWDPSSSLSAGFWFSCVAVWLLVMMDDGTQSVFETKTNQAELSWFRRGVNWVWTHAKTSVVLTPMSLMLFGNVSLIGLVANFVAIPVVGWVITPFLLMATLLVPVSALPLLWVDQIWHWMMALLMPLMSIPFGFWRWGALPMWAWLFVMLGIIWLVLPRSFFSRWLAVICFFPLWVYQPIRLSGLLPQGQLYIEFIDVGQGNAVWVKTANHTLLFDTGPPAASWSLRLRLQQLDGLTPDVLVLSHSDNDHMGGFERLTSNQVSSNILRAKTIHSSFDMSHHAHQDCSNQIPSWRWDDVVFRYLNEPAKKYTNNKDNDKSCVLLIETAEQKILLAGDIESAAEARLLNVLPADIDVLLVPHHGSKTSSTPAFVEKTSPELAIVQSGLENRYGHPHVDVMRRYEQIGTFVLNTSATGAIGIFFEGNERRVKLAR